MRSVLVYSVLRVLAFAVPFGILLLFPAFRELPWLAAVFAAIIGLALSMLLLRRPLDAVSSGLSDRRRVRRGERADADVEDDANDAARTATATDAAGGRPSPGSATGASDPADDATVAGDDAAAAGGSRDQPTNAQNSSPA